ncbi:MAG: hypothetical protein QM773_01105 [Hyphomonadaceae bacterium]
MAKIPAQLADFQNLGARVASLPGFNVGFAWSWFGKMFWDRRYPKSIRSAHVPGEGDLLCIQRLQRIRISC